jgi:hypothetical protein
MTEGAKQNRAAVRALVQEAAAGLTTRVPWRAAAMLENFDHNLVEAEIRGYTGDVANPAIFPDAILAHKTVSKLTEAVENPSISAEKRDKLNEALRQIRAEFRERAAA